MTPRPPITISTHDYNRLQTLLARAPGPAEVADELQEELARATLLEPAQMPADVAAMHSRLRFRNEASGQEFEVELVFPQEAPGHPDRLSVLAPAGAALLGLKAGEAIEWPVANGDPLRLQLLEVLTPAPH